jgi:hypothetical protein
VDEVLARFFLPVNILINEDFPTFDRPMKANSGFPSVGHFAISVFEMRNVASLIIMVQRYLNKNILHHIEQSLSFLVKRISRQPWQNIKLKT